VQEALHLKAGNGFFDRILMEFHGIFAGIRMTFYWDSNDILLGFK
jgi:hypothetical protein